MSMRCGISAPVGLLLTSVLIPLGQPARAQEAAAGPPVAMAAAFAPVSAPQTQHRDALRLLDYWLDAQVAYDHVPAVSAGVVIGQSLVWSGGYGFADAARRVPVSADTIYSICSISKLFTAVAVMQLWETGKLGLDDDLGKYLPAFKMARSDPDSGPVSLRSLLTHSSGLPRETLANPWQPPEFVAPGRDQALADLAQQKTLMRASDRHQYSNLGMLLLGEVVAGVSGQPYADYVQQHILQPLKLPETRPYLPKELLGTRLPAGHSSIKRDGKRDVMRPFDMTGLTAAAGYTSTVADLARFASWQFRLAGKGGSEVLKVATLRDMQRVQWTDPDGKTTWGFGFAVSREGANTVVSHGGICPGYNTALALALKDEVAVIALANANGVGPYTRQMRQIMLKGLRLPLATVQAGKPDLEAFAGRYAGQPWDSEIVIVPWGKDLTLLTLPSRDPVGEMQVLRHVDGDVFRMVRGDDSLGAEVAFDRDASNAVMGYRIWGRRVSKLAP